MMIVLKILLPESTRTSVELLHKWNAEERRERVTVIAVSGERSDTSRGKPQESYCGFHRRKS
jgi:hypothetical protein